MSVVLYEKRALQVAASKLGLEMVLLYGSRAGGYPLPNKESDLDIAALDPKPYSWDRRSTVYRALSEVFDKYELDLVFLREADPFFRYEILSRARLLYGSQAVFLEYKAFAFRDYTDSYDLRHLEEILFQKKFKWLESQSHGSS